jgi:hypothetical protein
MPRKRLLALITALLLVVTGAATAVSAAPAPAAAPGSVMPKSTEIPELLRCWNPLYPPGYSLAAWGYDTCGQCLTAGDAGIARGEWRAYLCSTFTPGLDVTYPLFVQ